MRRSEFEPGGMEMLGGYLLECVTHAIDPLDRRFAEALGAAAPSSHRGNRNGGVDTSGLNGTPATGSFTTLLITTRWLAWRRRC